MPPVNESPELSPRPATRPESSGSRAPVDWRYVLAAALAAVLLYGRLLRSAPFARDDFWWVYQRIPGYLDALAGGQFPPRTFPLAFEGAGYAFPHFYPPLGHWVAAAFAALTGSPVYGVHLSFLAAVVLASVFMFLLGRQFSGSDRIGLVAAVVYTALPYHVADVFYRGALAETWAFVWFPAIALAVLRGLAAERVSLSLPLAVCALFLSHSVLALYFAIGCAFALLWIWRERGPARALDTLAGAATGGALALWYLLPVQESLPGVWAGDAVFMKTTEEAARGAAPTLDKPYFLMGLVPLVLVGVVSLQAWRRADLKRGILPLLSGLVAFTAFAYLPGLFQPILPARLAYIQFPWRVFAITGFLASAIIALALRSSAGTRLGRLIATAAVIVSLPLAAFAGGRRSPEAGPAATGAVTYTVLGDYLPKPLTLPMVVAGAADRTKTPGEDRVVITRAGLTIFPGSSAAPGPRTLPLHYYPFYAASRADGERLPLASSEGYVQVYVADSPVRVTVVNPPSFWVGLTVGLGSLALLVLYRLLVARRPAPRRSHGCA